MIDPHATPTAGNDLPPLVLTLQVEAPAERAFDYFVRDWGVWWPRHSHSVCQADAQSVSLEAHVGGRLLEQGADGTTHCWGTVERYDPPRSLRFTWHPGGVADRALWVEVSFAANAKGTLVTLVQGGWAVLQDRAAPARAGYEQGWGIVLMQVFAGYCKDREVRS
ncbi:MAG: SRPBCC domain-containing protein [Burkholderiales bacterium]|nr:SRPBCC domain-containing protein [Burkholderiales bacterium]